MMNIESLNVNKNFNDVSKGQFFAKEGVIYLKIKAIEDSEGNTYNAVSTATGYYYHFDYYTAVDTVLKGKYNVTFS